MKPLFDIDKKTKKEIDTHIKKDNNSYDKFNISDEMLDNVYKIYMNLSVLNNTSDGDKYILDLFKYREFINNVEEFRAEENGTHILVIPVTQ